MIIVITGQPRHGKSQFAVSMMYDYQEENIKNFENKGKNPRSIVTNIYGINSKDVKNRMPWVEVQSNEQFEQLDYNDYPDGTIFFIDECHKFSWVRDTRGSLSDNPIIISMNEHAHRDFTLVLMTQFPQYIHTHIHGLVETHFHIKRPSHANFAFVYEWGEFQKNPRSESAFKNAVSKKRFKYKKKFQDSYKSASAHDSVKFRVPQKAVYAIILILVFLVPTVYKFFNSPIGDRIRGISREESQAKNKNNVTTNKETQLNQSSNSTSNSYSVTPELISFPVPELNEKYLHERTHELAYHEDVRPSMIIRKTNSDGSKECRVFNSKGETLNIKDKDCNLMSDRPSFIPRSRLPTSIPSYLQDSQQEQINS